LTTGLMLGGFAMQRHQTSRPASGAEHQFSHLWDMEHLTGEDGAPSHGFKVGVATLAVAALYEALLRRPLEQLDVAACCAAWPDWAVTGNQIRTMFAATDFIATPLRESQLKHPSREELQIQLQQLKSRWPQLRDRLRAHLQPAAELRRNLELVGAPVTPEAIGLTRTRLRESFRRARSRGAHRTAGRMSR
jgi:glycerol-1-phosphate dehydrogenase [NAD(P)+]